MKITESIIKPSSDPRQSTNLILNLTKTAEEYKKEL